MDVIHDKAHSRFTTEVEGTIAKVDYRLEGKRMYLTYAEVPPHLRGRGIGRKMVEQVFEMLTVEGYEGVAVCGFVRSVALDSERWSMVIK